LYFQVISLHRLFLCELAIHIITTLQIWIAKTYEWVQLDILTTLRSELKLKILLSLLNGEKKISDLRFDAETRDTTILHVLQEFGDLNLTTKTQGLYKLSPLGIIEAKILKEFISTGEVVEKFKDFWLSHNVDDIPAYLLQSLGALKDAKLVRTHASELGIVHQTFIEGIRTSKKIKGISPIFHPDFISSFGELLEQGSTIELIVSSDVINKITGFVELDLIMKYLKEDKLRVYLKDDLKIALALTESSFSLGLFALSGSYDDSMDLRSNSVDAIKWGERLFEDAVKGSQRIGLDL
jgi:predicted transcriptional regulator